MVEAVIDGQETGLVAAVPLPDHLGAVAGVREDAGEADLALGQAQRLTGEEDRQSLERPEADPGG